MAIVEVIETLTAYRDRIAIEVKHDDDTVGDVAQVAHNRMACHVYITPCRVNKRDRLGVGTLSKSRADAGSRIDSVTASSRPP